MFHLLKLPENRTNIEIVKEIRRCISKTPGVTNCFATFRHHDNIPKLNLKDGSNNNCSKWINFRRQNSKIVLSSDKSATKSAVDTSLASKKESQEFMATFPEIVKDITDCNQYTGILDATRRLKNALEYILPGGKLIRGHATVVVYKMLEKPENLTSENIRLANILGWCSELFLAYCMVMDDIIDNSEIRRNNLCWYRKPEIGLTAVIDGSLVNFGLYRLLKKYFSSLPCYVPILELYHDISFKGLLGELLDTLCVENNKPRLDIFTMDRYMATGMYKTGYCAFHLSIASAMYLANIFDEELHRQSRTILLEIGQLLQIQDDVLDCFGNPKVMKKIGTDIQNGKCTWLAVVALERATPTQRAIMEEHYGKPEEKSVQAIRNLYEELNLPSIYTKYEEESLNLFRIRIQQLPKELPRDFMLRILKRMYKREY